MTVIQDIMSRHVVAIRPETTLSEAARILDDNRLPGAPVVSERGEVVGSISEADMLDMLFDLSQRQAPVSSIMSHDVPVVNPDESLSRAAHMFELYGMHCLPVVDAGSLVGVVTRRDLLKYANQTTEPLEEPIAELIHGLEGVF